METSKKYRPTSIPYKYQQVIRMLNHYGFGSPRFIIEEALNQHAMAFIEEILSDPQTYKAEDNVEYLKLLLEFLKEREKAIDLMRL